MSQPQKAIWIPAWYELDQSISVGQLDRFYFFRETPVDLREHGCLVFFCGIWREEAAILLQGKILSIENSHFGAIQGIDTRGLDYTLTLLDGREQKVEAEQSPGLVYGWPEPITDWQFHVELELPS